MILDVVESLRMEDTPLLQTLIQDNPSLGDFIRDRMTGGKSTGEVAGSATVQEIGSLCGGKISSFWKDSLLSQTLTPDQKSSLAETLYFTLLRNTGRDFNDPKSVAYRSYELGRDAIAAVFPESSSLGSVFSRARDIRTQNGGGISIFAPTGGVTLSSIDPNQKDPPFGIVSAYGGAVNIYSKKSVGIGIGRIFTLRGGDIVIWSDKGDIAAGSSAKTVLSAPPTRVLLILRVPLSKPTLRVYQLVVVSVLLPQSKMFPSPTST